MMDGSRILKPPNPFRDLIPNPLDPLTVFQERENIDQPIYHGFKTGFVEGEWYFPDIQT